MSNRNYEAVVIGASAGALEALMKILPALPRDYPLPVLVVVHLPPDQKSIMADLLRARCHLIVCEAEDKEPIKAGTVYFAAPDYHLLVEMDRSLSFSSEEPVLYSRPAIDVLFETAADVYGPSLLGVILTGASSDGAKGLRSVMDAGGDGLVQQPKTAYAAAMPSAALEACPFAQALNIANITEYLQKAPLL